MPLSRVVWSEGMHLAQHHFQAQNRYFENSVNFAISNLFFKSYGVAGLELDAEALRNGTASLIHARGVMPDGLPFHFPDADRLPPTRHVREFFSPTQDRHLLFLTIPPHRPGDRNCAMPEEGDSPGARYIAEAIRLKDETTGRDEKSVDLGRKNFRLMLETEQREHLVSLPLARVRRDGSGHFIYDNGYVPPSLQIGASPRLMELLERLIEVLEVKSEALAAKRRSDRKALADYAAQEVASFWVSHTVHSSLAPLRHHLQAKRSRPEQLYCELARLAGALCTFSLKSHPRDLPLYDHDRLEDCFGALDKHIRAHLEIIIPTACVSIPLQRAKDYFYTGVVKDKRCFGPSEWILGVRSSLGEVETITGVPRLVKVFSAKYVFRLVQEGRSGLPLEHLSSPPSTISPRIGTRYFRIRKTGASGSPEIGWQAIQQSADVGVYVPGALGDVELDLLIVLEGQQD